jgi:hypothetical protein
MAKNTYLDPNDYPLNRLPKTVKGLHHLSSWPYTLQVLMNLEDGGDPWVVMDHLIVQNALLQKSIDQCVEVLTQGRSRSIQTSGECFDECSPGQ